MRISILSLVFGLLISGCVSADRKLAEADHCQWKHTTVLGKLDTAVLPEASGLAASADGRLYHVNDSKNENTVFVTDYKGRVLQQFNIKNTKNRDVEDLGYGKCPAQLNLTHNCLYVADIGSNENRYENTRTIWVLEEKNQYDVEETPVLTLRFELPDRKMDAEGLAIHPNGHIYLLTKNFVFQTRTVGENFIYKITPAAQAAKVKRKKINASAEKVVTMDLRALNPTRGVRPDWSFQVPTGLNIHPSGKSFLVLTYSNAMEFDMDLDLLKEPLTVDKKTTYRTIPLRIQSQQEAITYTPDGSHFLYTSEFADRFPQNLFPSSELVQLQCVE